MSDSWPAPPPGDDASDSLAGQALEVERALKALEAVDAFRAEAAALRAELQAIRASGTLAGRGPRRRAALRRGVGAPEGAWRLAAECAVIVGAAVVAWAFHLGRVGILLTLGGTWLVVAVFEAVASRSPQTTWVPPPPAAMPPPPVRAVASPPAAAPAPPELPEFPPEEVGWPSRLEPVAEPAAALESVEVEQRPEPEPQPEPEPEPELEPEAEAVLLVPEIEPDGGPSAGAVAVLEEVADLRVEDDARRRWWPRFGKQEKHDAPAAALLEPEPDPVELSAQLEPSFFIPEVEPEEEEVLEQDSVRQPRRWWLLRGREEPPGPGAALTEPEPLADELEPEAVLEPEPEREPEPEPLYAFSQVEPDGGPSVGAFVHLEEEATLRAQPQAEPEYLPRLRRRRLRRRRSFF